MTSRFNAESESINFWRAGPARQTLQLRFNILIFARRLDAPKHDKNLIHQNSIAKTPKLKLNLETPKPLVFENVEWVIVTEDNIDSIWEAIKKDNKGVALFALKDDDYGRLAMNLAAIREALGEYVIILKKYKEYYEGD